MTARAATAIRDTVLTALEEARQDWVSKARDFLNSHPVGSVLTVNDVRDHVPPPADIDGRAMGCVFRTEGWVPTGFVLSNRRTCHGRPIRQFTKVA